MSPRGVPNIGNWEPTPHSEVLGTVKETVTDSTPQASAYLSGSVEMVEPPPPWEVDEKCLLPPSDARRFVEVPANWELRWINPKLLDQLGWRWWAPVMASDERVKVLVQTMVSPEGNIRRGGTTGDILAWMYASWVESRRKERQKLTDQLTQSAVDRQETLKDEFRRGKWGPNVQLDKAVHPTHTMLTGTDLKDVKD